MDITDENIKSLKYYFILISYRNYAIEPWRCNSTFQTIDV